MDIQRKKSITNRSFKLFSLCLMLEYVPFLDTIKSFLFLFVLNGQHEVDECTEGGVKIKSNSSNFDLYARSSDYDLNIEKFRWKVKSKINLYNLYIYIYGEHSF